MSLPRPGFIIAILLIVLCVLIAGVHWILPGLVERSMNVVEEHPPYEVSSETRALHSRLFVADLHADTMLWKRNMLEESARGHVDLPRLQQGNVALQLFAAVTKSPAGQNYESNTAESDSITALAVAQLWPPGTWSSLFERAMYQLEKLKAFAAASDGELTLILSREDLAALIEAREGGTAAVGAVFVIEGAHALEGDIQNLDRLHGAGLRVMGLTHFFDNELGGSLHGVSGDGLTEFGRQVVERANELGLIIDVAHASQQMVRDVLALSDRPVIVSHGGLKSRCDMDRNLPDELMLEIASRGGILGIGYWDAAVCDYTPEGIVESIRHAIDLMGEDHVALGSDYDGSTTVRMDTSELAILTEIMRQRNFTETEIRKVMGDNVKRFMLTYLPPGTLQ